MQVITVISQGGRKNPEPVFPQSGVAVRNRGVSFDIEPFECRRRDALAELRFGFRCVHQMHPGNPNRVAGAQDGTDVVRVMHIFDHDGQVRLPPAEDGAHPVQALLTYRSIVVRVIIHCHEDDSTGPDERAQLGEMGIMTEVDERWQESNADLVKLIRDEIQANGPIRFDRFMELTLYHPVHGYYRMKDPAPGRSGDFLTAPEAHPIFGATLARQVEAFDRRLDHPKPFMIFEYGAGSGKLIRPLLASIRQNEPDLYDRVRYVPIELNEYRRSELLQHLETGGHSERVHLEPPDGGATGCVLANEFLDAWPARRFTMTGNGLHEILVSWDDDWFAEQACPVADDDQVHEYVRRHEFEPQPGEAFEYHPGFADWINELRGVLATGFVLIIDYGYPAEELFREHRRTGTVKGYYQHGVTDQLFRGVGHQDLTAHINFSEIAWLAESSGFEVEDLVTQAELLERLGIGERLFELQSNEDISADEYLAVRAAVIRMIDPGAMGRFRAMILKRGVQTTE